jgi:hypothetical protein
LRPRHHERARRFNSGPAWRDDERSADRAAPSRARVASHGGDPARVADRVGSLIAAHPFALDIPFAAVHVAIGVGLLIPRTARFAHASIINGAPGSVFVYGLITLAAWQRRGRSDIPPAPCLPRAWAGLWIGAGIYQALPYNNTGADVQSVIVGTGAPDFLSKFTARSPTGSPDTVAGRLWRLSSSRRRSRCSSAELIGRLSPAATRNRVTATRWVVELPPVHPERIECAPPRVRHRCVARNSSGVR